MKVLNGNAMVTSVLLGAGCLCFIGVVYVDAQPQFEFGARFGGFMLVLAGLLGFGFWRSPDVDVDYSVAGIMGVFGTVLGLIAMFQSSAATQTDFRILFGFEMLMAFIILGFLFVPSIQWRSRRRII